MERRLCAASSGVSGDYYLQHTNTERRPSAMESSRSDLEHPGLGGSETQFAEKAIATFALS